MNPYDAVSAAMSRREKLAAPQTANPWATPRWACLAYPEHHPLGGYHGSEDHVRALSEPAGCIWVRDHDGTTRVLCGPECLRDLEADVRHGNRAAIERLEPLARDPHAVPVDIRTRTGPTGRMGEQVVREARQLTSVCRGCGAKNVLDQERAPGGEWQPSEKHVLTLQGWVFEGAGKWCSKYCHSRTTRAPLPGEPRAPTAVQSLAKVDVSYPAPRARTALEQVGSHELPSGPVKAPRKGPAKV
jgi:hypothetical protein